MSDSFFEVMHSDGNARAGVMCFGEKRVLTPYFQPIATRGIPKDATFEDVEAIGYPLILMNTYHLICRPGVEIISHFGGLKKFTGWRGLILTDSGGFQIFSLSPLREITPEGVRFRDYESGAEFFLSPESCVDTQLSFRSNVLMALDICTAYPAHPKKVEDDLRLTNEWALRAVTRFRDAQPSHKAFLFGIVQGGTDEGLRARGVEFISSLDFAGIAVGGLSVGESRGDYERIASLCALAIPQDKPRYLMGVGSPADILQAVSWGYDLFDCVLPTRMARHGVAYSFEGYVHIRQEKWNRDASPLIESCTCRVCRNYSKAFLRHLFTADELSAAILLTYHNLFFYKSFMDAVREAILESRLQKLVDKISPRLSRKL